ncbi:MAG: hypothetical protein ACHQ7N_12450 [Candidatus Methylomirabilales bacterium]
MTCLKVGSGKSVLAEGLYAISEVGASAEAAARRFPPDAPLALPLGRVL